MDIFLSIITTVGFSSMVVGFIYIGRKLQILDDLKETIGKIKYNVKVIADFLTKKEPEFDHSKLQSYSPFHLTNEGKEFIALLGFDRVFGQYKKDFFDFIDEEAPRVKYDVELSAIKSIYFLLDKSFMNFLKTYMYNHPEKRINSIAPTLGVYIRDSYLAEHPEIN
jgi:hypothetical protein